MSACVTTVVSLPATVRETIEGRLSRAAGAPFPSNKTQICITDIVSVTAIRSKLAVVPGKISSVAVEIMLDSGSSVSLVQQQTISQDKHHNCTSSKIP